MQLFLLAFLLADHLHEHFIHPCAMKDGRYTIPVDPSCGYSIQMKEDSIKAYTYPTGAVWVERLAAEGKADK